MLCHKIKFLSRKCFCLFLLIVTVGQAKPNEKEISPNNGSSIMIKGDKQVLEISDIPLSQYQYDDLSFFTQNYDPEKDLLDLLEKPDVLMELDNKTVALEFDSPAAENTGR